MELTQRHHLAARLIAEDRLTIVEIAERCEVEERTVYNWKADDDFAKLVESRIKAYADRALRRGIARKENRLNTLQDLHEKTLQVIQERGEQEVVTVPGGKTGLVCRTIKSVNGRDVEEFKYDDAIVKTVLAIHEQVAEELGQKIRKFEHTGQNGEPIKIQAVIVDPKQLTYEQLCQLEGIVSANQPSESGSNKSSEGETSAS